MTEPVERDQDSSRAEPEPAIRCRGLNKVYLSGFWRRRSTGLHALDLEVSPGEVFGFIGPNGAGKTTTIKILVGLQRATSGQATIFGKQCWDPESRRRLGFLPEHPYFYQHLTARELLSFYGRLFDLGGSELDDRVQELLVRVQLEHAADRNLRTYSKGMVQRAGLAQSLLHQPSLLILDEPMSGLDPMGRRLIRDIILSEQARGTTVFFSSHILADVEMICDRVAMLVGGKLVGLGSVRELLQQTYEHVDCAFRIQEPLDWPGEVLHQDRGLVQVRVSPELIDELVRAVHARGGSVQEIQPHRRQLEDLLEEASREGGAE